MFEIIKDHPDYAVNHYGQVWSFKTNKYLSQYANTNGYMCLSLDGKVKKVHRLVAIAFVPNPDNLPDVDHDDEDKRNNGKWNLNWTDVKSNTIKSKHRMDTGQTPKPLWLDDMYFESIYTAAQWLCSKYDKKIDSVRRELRRERRYSIYGHVIKR